MKFPQLRRAGLRLRGRRSPALQAPLRFPAMAPGARVGAARAATCSPDPSAWILITQAGHVANYPLSPLRLPRATLSNPRACPELSQRAGAWAPTTHPGVFLSIPFPGAGGARSWAGHSRAGVPQTHPRRAGWKPSNPAAGPTDRPAMAPRAPLAPPVHSPRVPSLASSSNLQQSGPKWPPQKFSGARLAASARPRGGVRVCRAPGWGRRAAHRVPASSSPALSACPRSKAAPGGPRARPALPGHRRRPPRGSRTRRGDIPRPGHARSRRRSFLPRGNSTLLSSPGRPDIPKPSPGLPGPRSLAKGSGSSRPLQ